MADSTTMMERRTAEVAAVTPIFPLNKLPLGTRCNVYRHIANTKCSRIYLHDPDVSDEFQFSAKLSGGDDFSGFISLLQTNRTIYCEALPVLYGDWTFHFGTFDQLDDFLKRIRPGRRFIRDVHVVQYKVTYPAVSKLHALLLLAESRVLKPLTIAKMCSHLSYNEDITEFFSDMAPLMLETATTKGSKVAALALLRFEKDAFSSAEWRKTEVANVEAWFRSQLLDCFHSESHRKWQEKYERAKMVHKIVSESMKMLIF